MMELWTLEARKELVVDLVILARFALLGESFEQTSPFLRFY
jgi:hypothetical protein